MAVQDYRELFEAAGREWNIDPRVLMAVAQQESGGNPRAVSKAGARGVMQIMPGTGRDLGATDLHDPAQSIFAGAKYLSQLAQQYQRPELVLAAYNAGPARVDAFVSGRQPLPDETMAYLPAVAGAYQKIADKYEQVAQAPAGTALGAISRAVTGPAATALRASSYLWDPLAANTTNSQAQENQALGRPANAGPFGAVPGALPTDTEFRNQPAPPPAQDSGGLMSLLISGAHAAPPTPRDGLSDLEREALGLPKAATSAAPETLSPLELDALGAGAAAAPAPKAIPTNIVEGRQPGPIDQAKISLATDPEQRRRIAASILFPKETPEKAQERVFYDQSGRLAATDPSGKSFYVDPQVPQFSFTMKSPISGKPVPVNLTSGAPGTRMGQPLLYAATGAGPALPIAGGIAGSLLSAPSSLVAGPVTAAAGAAAGDLARQGLAHYVDPTPDATPYNLGQTGREAALSGAGQLAGATVNRFLSPNPLRLSSGERSAVAPGGPVMQETRDAYARAQAQGVDLTPGQATKLPSLLQYEDAATTMPQTVDRATDFYRNQGNQLQTAGQKMLDTISPNANKTDAALSFREGAQDAARSVRQQANAAARPLYQQAEAAGNVMSPDLAQLADVPVVKQAMDRAGKTYQNLYRTKPPGTPDFALWDLTKRQLDDAYTVASRAGERTDAMAIDKARQDLLGHLEAAYPTYAQARAIAAPGQRLASSLEDSGVGSAADTVGTERARAIVAPVFGQNPQAIAEARDAFAKAGRSNEWYAGVRAYIQDAFDKSTMSQQGLNPAMLRRKVWGDVDNRDAIRAALTPAQYRGFDNFLRTVEDVAKTFPMNSLTATRLNARGALQSAAEGSPVVRGIDAASTILSPFKWGNLGAGLLAGTRQRAVQRDIGRIVNNLFSPDGLQYLEAMSTYSPKSQRAIEATAQAISRATSRLLAAPEATESNPLAAPPAGQ